MAVSRIKFNRTSFFEPSNTLMCNFTAFVNDASEMSPNGEIDSYQWFTPDEARKNIRPDSLAQKFFIRDTIRRAISAKLFAQLDPDKKPTADEVNAFLNSLHREDRIVLLLDQVQQWAELGADNALVNTFDDIIRATP